MTGLWLQLTCSVILCKSFPLSVPWFLHLSTGDVNASTNLAGLFYRVKELLARQVKLRLEPRVWKVLCKWWALFYLFFFYGEGTSNSKRIQHLNHYRNRHRWLPPCCSSLGRQRSMSPQLCPKSLTGKADVNRAHCVWCSAREVDRVGRGIT